MSYKSILISSQTLGLNSGFLFRHISRISARAGSEARWAGSSWEMITCRGVSRLSSAPEAGARVILASNIPSDQTSTFLLHCKLNRYSDINIDLYLNLVTNLEFPSASFSRTESKHSGGRKPFVPAISVTSTQASGPGSSSSGPGITREDPKSISLSFPPTTTKLSGLMSQWITLSVWIW